MKPAALARATKSAKSANSQNSKKPAQPRAAAPKSAKPEAANSVQHPGAGEIRIIGGQWKRSRLRVAQQPGLRPTPDRVRETLFNWLGQDLSGWRCMDAFAGTGALGFEAASRGAASVQLWEYNAALVTQLLALQKQLAASNLRIQRGDGIAALRQLAPASMDLVLLDPPFESDLYAPALQAASAALAQDGYVYLEAPRAWTAAELADSGLVPYRYLKAGAVHAHLLRRG